MSSCVLAMFNNWLKMDTSFSTYEEGLQILSSAIDMVGENVLANQLKQECGKWNRLFYMSRRNYIVIITIIIMYLYMRNHKIEKN